jgi:hypothetical protein
MVSKKKSVWEIHETQGKGGLTKPYKSILMSQSASVSNLSYSNVHGANPDTVEFKKSILIIGDEN